MKKLISLNENDLIRLEQIVIDNDKEGALVFIKEVVKKEVDRESVLLNGSLRSGTG